jgi:hypothetical protein
MIQRILHSRHLLACLLSAATGMALYFRAPFPEDNIFLPVMAMRSLSAFLFLKYSYTLFLYTTLYLVYSILFSAVYIFALKTGRRIRAGKLPLYSDPRKRTELSLVVGEVHYPRKDVPSETPRKAPTLRPPHRRKSASRSRLEAESCSISAQVIPLRSASEARPTH